VERDNIFRTRLAVPASAWVAPNATLVGDVSLGERASVWFGCVLRGDLEPIVVGDETNVQDGTIVHVDRGSPVRIGRRVTIGHRSVVHGCVVEDEATIGMGAVLLSGSRIGRGALVAAGALVTEGFEVPEGMIAAGVPAKLRGKLPDKLAERFRGGVDSYLALSKAYREGRLA
jgi:carbonic anhydrase/acetyltransferase-like protein (isoleucine patch superfamily)